MNSAALDNRLRSRVKHSTVRYIIIQYSVCLLYTSDAADE